ncbi:hypothetical protein DSL72_009511 [Monilinia vaccinii-corymbosi]|uniref:Uncharacterized protein n=1 Tax=Monilinia vaccinii-corymbosi TaxID=61207 RepID=A0A8A3PQY0_9HELO|nr:hypothetical protein DSL72_009511 [Monilinia vaccinii-corymbosi]
MPQNHPSRFLEERQRRERAARRAPSMERMQVPVIASPPRLSLSPTFPPTRSTSTSTLASMRMSTPELEGSEYLEPILADSTYTRRLESSVQDTTGQTESKPWGFEQYTSLLRRQTARDVGMVKGQPGAHRSPTCKTQHVQSSGGYKAPLTAEQQEQRGRIARESRAREEEEKKEAEEDNALMDSFDFEPTIAPHVPKFQHSFADRKAFSSSRGSSGGSERRG